MSLSRDDMEARCKAARTPEDLELLIIEGNDPTKHTDPKKKAYAKFCRELHLLIHNTYTERSFSFAETSAMLVAALCDSLASVAGLSIVDKYTTEQFIVQLFADKLKDDIASLQAMKAADHAQ